MTSSRAPAPLERPERVPVPRGGDIAPASLVHPSWALGTVVVVGIIVLQAAADLVAGREHARIVARLLFLAFELPILMLALSAAFGWSVRRRLSAPQGLAAGVAISMVIGCAFGLLYGLVAKHVPDLRLNFPSGASPIR